MLNTHTKTKKLHTVNITDDVYKGIKHHIQEKGGTFTEFVNTTLSASLNRYKLIEMYTPDINEDFISENAIYLNDSKLNKIAIVRLKEFPDTDLDNTGLYAYCEICDSDSCIHVRHALVTGSILKLSILCKKV